MEKDPQPESFTTVTVKDYSPSHAEMYVNEPPPAYKKPKSSLVQVARIIAMTIIALAVTFGVVHLSSIYIQANAMHRLQQLQNRHEQKISLMPKSEPLVQQQQQQQQQNEEEDDDNTADYNDKKSENVELKKHVRRDFMDNNKIDGEDDNSIETDDDKSANPLHVKFPIQLDLDDLPEALMGGSANKNQKSRMNCIVEKKIAEKMVNHEPKNIQLPFGVNLTTDKGFEHLTGEKIIILCESGNEQQPQQVKSQEQEQPQPQPQSPQIQQNVQPIPFIRREPFQWLPRAPVHRQQMIFPIPIRREPEHEMLGRYHMFKPQFINKSPLPIRFPIQNEPKIMPEPVKEPMVFFTPERLQFMHDFSQHKNPPATISLIRNEEIKKPPMNQVPIIPQFIQSIAEEIIRDHIESQTEKAATVQNENNVEAQRLPSPEVLLTDIDRLSSPEMILSITAERENIEPANIPIVSKERNNDDKQAVAVERENEDEEDNDSETESKAVMEMVHESETKPEQAEKREENANKKEEASQSSSSMEMTSDVPVTTVSANTANVREGRDLTPVQIPVQMIPQQDSSLQGRPHYVHPRSV